MTLDTTGTDFQTESASTGFTTKTDNKIGAKMSGAETKGRHKKTEQDQTIIKKYANRRLYNTATSAYVTLDNLADMVRKGEEFVVYDAKSGEDITRSVLTQIIFEEESRGQNLLPIQFLRQLIGYYGDSMQSLLPSYLEMSLDGFKRQQETFREQMQKAFGASGFPNPLTGQINAQMPGMSFFDDQVKQNLAMFERAVRVFSPFSYGTSPQPSRPTEATKTASETSDVNELRDQLESMRQKLDQLANKS